MKTAELRRIAVLRNDRLGDLVCTLPLFEALRHGCPAAHITAMVSPATAGLLNHHPHVDEVLSADKRMPTGELARMIGAGRYDAILLTHCTGRNALAALRARVPIRVTHARRWFRLLCGTHRFYVSRRRPPLHEADFALAFAHRLGIAFSRQQARPYLHVDPGHRDQIEHKIVERLGTDGPLFAVHPGGLGSVFNWPLENYLETVRRLAAVGRVIMTPGPADRESVDWIVTRLAPEIRKRVLVIPDLGVAEMIAALSLVDGFVSTSTGPLHVAAIVSRRAVGLLSETRHGVELWRPIGPNASLLVAPWTFAEKPELDSPRAAQHMAQITVEAVVEQMLEAIGQQQCAA